MTSSWPLISCWNIAPTMPPKSSSAFCSAARSSLSRPSSAIDSRNSVISADSAPSAAPLFRTILRKKKSCAWIAVVPSYRVSILASRMYCSSG